MASFCCPFSSAQVAASSALVAAYFVFVYRMFAGKVQVEAEVEVRAEVEVEAEAEDPRYCGGSTDYDPNLALRAPV